MEKRILITGAAGFIGTNLLNAMKRHGMLEDSSIKILTVDAVKPTLDVAWHQADISTTDWGFLEGFKPTHVLHLGALTNHRLCSDLNKSMSVNVNATQRLLSRLALLGGVSKIIFPSSIVVYAEHARMPLNEETSPIDFHHNHYSLTKGLCEELCQHFRKPPYNLPILTFRLSNIYGPHQEWRPERFPNLIPQIITQAIRDKKIDVWNSTPVRDFVYVEDAVEAFLLALDSTYAGTINIASGVGTSVGSVCQEISKLTGAPISDQGKQTSGPHNIVCDTSRAAIHLGWKAKTTLTEGVKKTVEYYQRALGAP